MFNKLHLPLGMFGKANENSKDKDKDKVPSPRTKDAKERDTARDTKESKDNKSPKGITALLSPGRSKAVEVKGEGFVCFVQFTINFFFLFDVLLLLFSRNTVATPARAEWNDRSTQEDLAGLFVEIFEIF